MVSSHEAIAEHAETMLQVYWQYTDQVYYDDCE